MAKTQVHRRQPYPRDDDLLAKIDLFPIRTPPISKDILVKSIRNAFIRANTTKVGEIAILPRNPQALAKISLKHLETRTDPILGSIFYSKVNVNEIFELDAVAHEMQRYRMKMGNFFQYLVIELMSASTGNRGSNFKKVFDGTREGDVVADIATPNFDKNLRLYISVKKSPDTVGGQDVAGQISRIEQIPKTDKNLTSPYLCVIAIATEAKPNSRSYEEGRKIKGRQDGRTYSDNCEVWYPSFLFPYISGWSVIDVYKEISEIVEEYLPFNTLVYRKEASKLLRQELIRKHIISKSDKILSKEQFFKLIME